MSTGLPDLLPLDKRTRLARLLGMLGSDHDGEVANAGRLADRLIRDAGLTWEAVILGGSGELAAEWAAATAKQARKPRPPRASRPPPPPRADRRGEMVKAQMALVRWCAASSAHWTEWQVGFLAGCADQLIGGRALSARQLEILDGLADRAQSWSERERSA